MSGTIMNNERQHPDITGIVLAGGASRRMGTNKALLRIGEKRSIEHAVASLKQRCSRVLVSANQQNTYAFLGLQTVLDRYPQKGPMAGIHAGLSASKSKWNIVAACDMPFIHPGIVHALAKEAEAADSRGQEIEAVIPVVEGRLQPLLAVYRREVRLGLEHRLEQGELRVTDWICGLRKITVDEKRLKELTGVDPAWLLFNMNHPEDYTTACSWLDPGQED